MRSAGYEWGVYCLSVSKVSRTAVGTTRELRNLNIREGLEFKS